MLNRYEPLFFNANFKEEASDAGWLAYRGELILKEGEIADAQGRRKPPIEVMKQAILLSCGNELKFFSGSLDELQFAHSLVEKYAADLKKDAMAVLFTVNIDQPFISMLGECPAVFIPMVQGMVWNELVDLVALEKGDFKGQSAADKVKTLYSALRDQRFTYPVVGLAEAMEKTNHNKRETHGAV